MIETKLRARRPAAGPLSQRADIPGASGQTYAFTRLEADKPLRPVGVTWVVATQGKGGWRVLQTGETNNLADGSWKAPLQAAQAQHPKAACLIRLNVSRSVREAELADIGHLPGADPVAADPTHG